MRNDQIKYSFLWLKKNLFLNHCVTVIIVISKRRAAVRLGQTMNNCKLSIGKKSLFQSL